MVSILQEASPPEWYEDFVDDIIYVEPQSLTVYFIDLKNNSLKKQNVHLIKKKVIFQKNIIKLIILNINIKSVFPPNKFIF